MFGRRVTGLLLTVCALAACALTACGDDDAPDGGGRDSGPTDGGVVDAAVEADGSVDAGPPAPMPCDLCRRDVECGVDALCLVLADGDRGCGAPCTTDDDCAGLPFEARCEEEVPGLPLQCRPTRATCITVPLGTECASDAECGGRYDRCVDSDGLGGRCTNRCDVDADCGIGFHRCDQIGGERVCTRDLVPGPDRCSALATACAPDGSCSSGMPCINRVGGDICVVPETGGLEDPCEGELPVVVDGTPGCLPYGCECVLDLAGGSMFDDALAELGRTRCDLHFPTPLVGLYDPRIVADPYRLRVTERLWSDWDAVVPEATSIADRLDEASSIGASLAIASGLVDQGVPGGAAEASASFVDAITALLTSTGGTADRATIEADAAALPTSIQTAVTPIVDALREAHRRRELALARLAGDRAPFFEAPSGLIVPGLAAADLRRSDHAGALRGDVDVRELANAAAILASAIEGAGLASLGTPGGTFTIDTPIGRVAVRGGMTNDVYDDATWHETALLVDLGGDDTYRFGAGANASVDNGIAVVVDVRGDDTYGYDVVASPLDVGPAGHVRVPSDADGRSGGGAPPASRSRTSRQGAGRLGVGMLIDLEGADHYASHRMSQGYGALGVGVLFDAAGDDVYEAELASQGAASFGIGLLLDRAGSDRYVAYSMSQGFAYARAAGILDDRDGDDTYFLHPSDVLYPSAQDPSGSNSTLGQGAGFGRRADGLPDQTFMSGGVGVLHDGAGADHYTAAIFAQGCGYWFGTGFLVDDGGNDTYDGQWYVQGSAAHFAISALVEGGGDDIYNESARRQNVVLGGGHDFSVSWCVDRAGTDTYYAPGLSFGAGNAAGFGVFADATGDDVYDATSQISFGNASIETPGDTLRQMVKTVGIYLDADGADTYARPTVAPVANDATWRQTVHTTDEGEEGVGIDRTGGALGF